MNSPHIEVSTESPLWDGTCFDADALAREIIPIAFAAAEKDFDFAETEINVVLTDDETVCALNRDYRGKDKPTNVLSFAALEGGDMPPPAEGPVPLGDIVMAFETLKREAETMDISLRAHYIHLLIHGTLHLLGYDHEEDDEAEIMEGLEIQILADLGIENPYAGDKFVA